jgi:hypothetical protein
VLQREIRLLLGVLERRIHCAGIGSGEVGATRRGFARLATAGGRPRAAATLTASTLTGRLAGTLTLTLSRRERGSAVSAFCLLPAARCLLASAFCLLASAFCLLTLTLSLPRSGSLSATGARFAAAGLLGAGIARVGRRLAAGRALAGAWGPLSAAGLAAAGAIAGGLALRVGLVGAGRGRLGRILPR